VEHLLGFAQEPRVVRPAAVHAQPRAAVVVPPLDIGANARHSRSNRRRRSASPCPLRRLPRRHWLSCPTTSLMAIGAGKGPAQHSRESSTHRLWSVPFQTRRCGIGMDASGAASPPRAFQRRRRRSRPVPDFTSAAHSARGGLRTRRAAFDATPARSAPRLRPGVRTWLRSSCPQRRPARLTRCAASGVATHVAGIRRACSRHPRTIAIQPPSLFSCRPPPDTLRPLPERRAAEIARVLNPGPTGKDRSELPQRNARTPKQRGRCGGLRQRACSPRSTPLPLPSLPPHHDVRRAAGRWRLGVGAGPWPPEGIIAGW